MIEMVPLCFRVADDLSRPATREDPRLLDGENGAEKGSTDGVAGGNGSGSGIWGEEEEEGRREVVRRRLEGVGYRVGLGIVER